MSFLIALGCSAALASAVFAQGGENVQTVKVSSMAGLEAVFAAASGLSLTPKLHQAQD
ncbi:MAG: hypothetical protein K2X81_24505 [Candidatus Obscuribacterales bacterium]|nr:hypothetical protein [Candidatus Obscuribacterales bacterium]